MDIQYRTQCTERKTRCAYRRYYYFVFAPVLINYLLFSIMLILFACFTGSEHSGIFYGIALGCIAAAALSETAYSRRMLKLLRFENIFKVPSEVHLTDHWFEVKRGENLPNLARGTFHIIQPEGRKNLQKNKIDYRKNTKQTDAKKQK